MSSYLIVGAGLFGATCARMLADAGQRVHVIERREHIAGNCYDETIDDILCNAYGGHVFHTNARRVWEFVNRFAEWQQYEHRVKACHNGRIYSLPPNLATLDALGLAPGEEAEEIIRAAFFYGYTRKQWGREWRDLPAGVRRRVPIRYNYDDRYFTDRWQALPVGGYTALVRTMLRGIPVETGIDYLMNLTYWNMRADRVIYTGPLDALFNHEAGRLEYRSLDFRHETLDCDDYQGCATINYPDEDYAFTRVMEWKHFGWRDGPKGRTRITVEFPAAAGEPYYPIGDETNRALYARYTEMAAGLPWLRVGGRLGMYQYLNMDQAIAAAMRLAEKELSHG